MNLVGQTIRIPCRECEGVGFLEGIGNRQIECVDCGGQGVHGFVVKNQEQSALVMEMVLDYRALGFDCLSVKPRV